MHVSVAQESCPIGDGGPNGPPCELRTLSDPLSLGRVRGLVDDLKAKLTP
jgi:hypothetical protein